MQCVFILARLIGGVSLHIMRLIIKQAMSILTSRPCRQEKKKYQKIKTADLTYLPLNFGLASPLVSCDNRVGVANEQQAECSYQKYHEA